MGVGPNSCGARSNPLTRTQLWLGAFLAWDSEYKDTMAPAPLHKGLGGGGEGPTAAVSTAATASTGAFLCCFDGCFGVVSSLFLGAIFSAIWVLFFVQFGCCLVLVFGIVWCCFWCSLSAVLGAVFCAVWVLFLVQFGVVLVLFLVLFGAVLVLFGCLWGDVRESE